MGHPGARGRSLSLVTGWHRPYCRPPSAGGMRRIALGKMPIAPRRKEPDCPEPGRKEPDCPEPGGGARLPQSQGGGTRLPRARRKEPDCPEPGRRSQTAQGS